MCRNKVRTRRMFRIYHILKINKLVQLRNNNYDTERFIYCILVHIEWLLYCVASPRRTQCCKPCAFLTVSRFTVSRSQTRRSHHRHGQDKTVLSCPHRRCELGNRRVSCERSRVLLSRPHIVSKHRYWHIMPNAFFDQIWHKGVSFGTLFQKFSTAPYYPPNLIFFYWKMWFLQRSPTYAVIATQKLYIE